MILSWCIITKGDEELHYLEGAVKSIIDYVDEIVITTNGKETAKTKEFCSKYPKIVLSHLDWKDNFAEQRNYCASLVREDADYYGWMDTDDVIVNAHLLKDIMRIVEMKEYDTVFFTYWYGNKFDGKPSLDTFVETELAQMRERIIKKSKLIWKKRIHETPVPIDGENYTYSQVKYSDEFPIAWLHLGADRDLPAEQLNAKTERNRRILELELEDERRDGEADPRTILYLMKVYAELGEKETYQKCIDLGNEYLLKSGWDQERALCLQLMSRCMGYLGDDKKACKFIHEAIIEYPYNPLLYLYLARTYFNLGNYRAMKHWMTLGLNLDIKDENTATNNILELKVLSTELMFNYHYTAERNVRKAYESAKLLNKLNPTEQNKINEDLLYNQKELDIASEHAHKLMNYYREIGQEKEIPTLIDSLPTSIKNLPFAIKYYNHFKQPKVWGDKEICYFANFGGDHFERWDGSSLEKGIGGSETAVIRLSEELTKKGYKVTVYGHPMPSGTIINGVTYRPWYEFNERDTFNIFIQWRHNNLAGKIKAKKYFVDLHDIFFEESHTEKIKHIDGLFVKSNYHRSLAPNIDDSKFIVVSNGI